MEHTIKIVAHTTDESKTPKEIGEELKIFSGKAAGICYMPDDYIEEGELLKFPISFPEIEGIKWDYQTFLNEVFRRVHNAKFDCGKEEEEKNKKKEEEKNIIIPLL